MNTLIVIDSAGYDRNLVTYVEKFLTSDHDQLHFVYVIEVNQTLEIDAQMEIEVEKGEKGLGDPFISYGLNDGLLFIILLIVD